MVKQCAWCRKTCGEKPPYDDRSVTHGICQDCARQMLEAAAKSKPGRDRAENSVEFSEKV